MSWLRSTVDLSGEVPAFFIRTVDNDEIGAGEPTPADLVRLRNRLAHVTVYAPSGARGAAPSAYHRLVNETFVALTELFRAAQAAPVVVGEIVDVTLSRGQLRWTRAQRLVEVLQANERLAAPEPALERAVAARLVASADAVLRIQPARVIAEFKRRYPDFADDVIHLEVPAERAPLARADEAVPGLRAEHERREAILRHGRWLGAAEVADTLSPSGAEALKNPWDLASKLRRAGRLFGVKHGAQYRYPAFQFAGTELRPEVVELMRALAPVLEANPAGWQAASWLFAPHGEFDERVPADVFAADPRRVIVAAQFDFDPAARA